MGLFTNTSIKIKVLIAPGIMAIALGLILFIAIHGMEKQRRILTDAQERSLNRLKLVQDFITTSEHVQSDVYRLSVLQFMGAPKNEILPVSERLSMGLNNVTVIHGEILTTWTLDHQEELLLDELKTSLNAFRHQVQQAVMAVSKSPSFGILLVRSAAVPFSELNGLLLRLLEHQNDKIIEAKQNSEALLGQISTAIMTIALFMTLIAILMTVYIGSHYISKPIVLLTQLMGRLTDGDVSVASQGRERSDEIGQMEKALNVFRNNVIEKARSDKKLQESEDRFRTLYNNALVGLFRTRISDGVPLQINRRYAELAGYSSIEDCLENFAAATHYADPKVRDRLLEELKHHGEVNDFEAEIIRKDHVHFWISFSARVYPEDGNIEGALIDITDKKKAESKLVSSIKEKEVLLREIHHRVKNNMQIIQSLLSLQADRISRPEVKQPLIDSNNRIKSMALIHETLYHSDDMGNLDVKAYFNNVVNHLYKIYYNPEQMITLSIDIDSVELDLDRCIACGLIVNELVSNAMKYAFVGKPEGHLLISFRKQDDHVASLTVSDNGCGLPDRFDINTHESLGLKIVRILAEGQLKGSLSAVNENGATFQIIFPL
ncbi:MAG: PAS domain S-box protein [Proteobacteria bacterium]|nr:PAS domain S-box protein [Pseudomonadota bacterium]